MSEAHGHEAHGGHESHGAKHGIWMDTHRNLTNAYLFSVGGVSAASILAGLGVTLSMLTTWGIGGLLAYLAFKKKGGGHGSSHGHAPTAHH